MLNLGHIERPKKMALNTEEIDKINTLYSQLDVLTKDNGILTSENKLLKEQLSQRELFLDDRFVKLEELLKETLCACKK